MDQETGMNKSSRSGKRLNRPTTWGVFFLAGSLVVGFTACKSSAERQLEAGIQAMGRGQYREALDIFTEVVLLTPGSPEAARAIYDMGVIHYLKQRDLDAARSSFRKVLDEYPASDVAPEARRMLARVYEKEEGELHKAVQEYYRLLEHTDDQTKEKDILLDVANCYYRLDELEYASRLYRRIIEDYSYDEVSDHAYLRLAHIETLAGRGEEARSIIETLLERTDQPGSRRRAFLLAAEVVLQSSEYGRGRILLARADREFPGDPELLDLVSRLVRQEVDGRSLEEGDPEAQFLLKEMQRNISWGRGRRSRSVRR
jgi:tetratricopeptide (TPR) repeat protein